MIWKYFKWAPLWLRGLWFIPAIALILAFVLLNEYFSILSIDDSMAIRDFMNDIMVFLASTIIAVGGVTITGFIFFIESIRRLVDTNPIYIDTVDDMKEHLLRSVIFTFTFCVIYAIVCGFCMVTVFDDNGGDHGIAVTAGALMIVYGLLLLENLYLDSRVMGYRKYLREFADETRVRMQTKLGESDSYTIKVRKDEMHRLADEGMFPEDIEGFTGRVSCTAAGAGHDVSTTRYLEISDRYDAWDAMKFYNDTERILKKIAGLDNESFNSDDYKRLETALGAFLSEDAGMAEDIMENYRILKRYHDSIIVSDERNAHSRIRAGDNITVTITNLKPMLPRLSMLRFELVRKLSEKDLAGVILHGYDFSDGVLKNTILTGSKLIDSTFVQANLDCANLSDCDLSMCDFRDSEARSTVFDGSKMVRANLNNTDMSGSSFVKTMMRRSFIINSDMSGCVLTAGEVLSTEMRDSDFSGCDMRNANLSDVSAENTRFANSIFDGSRISDGTFRGCDFTGTNFGTSAINNMYFQDLTLNAVRFENADIMECIFVGCSLYDSFCSEVNFTGSVLMGVNLSEARISGCDFNKAMIGPYRAGKNGAEVMSPNFMHATMTSNTYTDSEIIDADFSYADMRKTRAGNTVFTRCDFTTADLTKARFRDCTFKDCKLPEGFEEMCTDCKFKPREE